MEFLHSVLDVLREAGVWVVVIGIPSLLGWTAQLCWRNRTVIASAARGLLKEGERSDPRHGNETVHDAIDNLGAVVTQHFASTHSVLADHGSRITKGSDMLQEVVTRLGKVENTVAGVQGKVALMEKVVKENLPQVMAAASAITEANVGPKS